MLRSVCQVILVLAVVVTASSQARRYDARVDGSPFEVKIYPKAVLVVQEGSSAVLDCREESQNRAPVAWMRVDGTPLPHDADGRLTIDNVQLSAAGRYECRVAHVRRGKARGNAFSSVVVVVEPSGSDRAVCPEGQAHCRSGECVSNTSFCDRRIDCADQSDELNCVRARKKDGNYKRLALQHLDGVDGWSCRISPWSRCDFLCKQYQKVICSRPGDRLRKSKRIKWCPRAHCTSENKAVVGWSNWSDWSTCSKTCGEAVRQRTRICNDPIKENCAGLPAEQQQCDEIPCPVHGEWSEWTDWTACTDLGSRTRERRCDNPAPQHNGNECVGVYLETEECQMCSSTIQLKLTPGRVRCMVGRPTTFSCEYCSDDAEKLDIEMDTEPSSSKGTAVHDNMHAQVWTGSCARRSWTLKLNAAHERVVCSLENSKSEVVGKVTSNIRIQYGFLQRRFTACLPGQFPCKNHLCIDTNLHCNGRDDCGDYSDEELCFTLPPEDSPEIRIDEPWQCGTDERFCPTSNICIPHSLSVDVGGWDWNSACGQIVHGESNCVRDQFCCATRQCVNQDCQCDGINDCGDFSDEIGCNYIGAPHRQPSQTLAQVPVSVAASGCLPEEIRCKSTNKCIPRSLVCDGIVDCDDASDEEPGCAWQKPSTTEKRATTRAAVISGQLAPVRSSTHCKEDQFACPSESRCLDWALAWCDGVKDCEDGSDEQGCPTLEPGANCTSMQFTCRNQECIPLHMFCDQTTDCSDESDEIFDCVKPTISHVCKRGEFKCRSVFVCLEESQQCNEKRECPDGSDELDCDGRITNEVLPILS